MKKIEILKKLAIESISDAMDFYYLEGRIIQLNPISKFTKAIGKAYTVKFCSSSDKEECVAADYIDDVPQNSMIVIDNNDISSCSVWGEILTMAAIQRQINGVLIYGACRDFSFNKQSSLPIFSRHVTCKTGKGVVKLESVQMPVVIQGVIINPDDYVVAENNTAIVIPNGHCDAIIKTAQKIEEMEGNIVNAIKNGVPLKEARSQFKYNLYK